MASEYKARLAKDVSELKRLDLACFPYDTHFNFEEGTWWILSHKGVVVAFCGVRELGGGMWFLCKAGVVSKHRGKGLQRRMIRLRERFARRQGGESMITYTLASNPASSNNLIACKYKLYEPQSYWAGNVNYWNKALS